MIQIEFNLNYFKNWFDHRTKGAFEFYFESLRQKHFSPLLLNLSDSVWEGGGLQRVKVASSSLSDSSIETRTQCAPLAALRSSGSSQLPGSFTLLQAFTRMEVTNPADDSQYRVSSFIAWYRHATSADASFPIWCGFGAAMCGWSRTSAVFLIIAGVFNQLWGV